jgi:hypothetical protein
MRRLTLLLLLAPLTALACIFPNAATATEIVAALERSESVAERETTLSLRSNAATHLENRREIVACGSVVPTLPAFSPDDRVRNCSSFGASHEFIQATSNLPNGRLPQPGIQDVDVGTYGRIRSGRLCGEAGCEISGLALPPEQEAFWQQLSQLCGQAFAGKIAESTSATDAAFKGQTLVMHVRACGENEIRIPFHVGENRSRTWVITRTATGLRLKHDHRHEDGNADKITQYGGDTPSRGTAAQQDFAADALTAELIPAAKTNVWSFIFGPNRTLSYRLVREAEGRRFRVEFDLTRPVPAPPAPWGQR